MEPVLQGGTLASGKPIAVVFEPSIIADSLFDLGSLNDIKLYLGVELHRNAPNRELVRQLIPALAEVEAAVGQTNLAEALSHATALEGRAAGRRVNFSGCHLQRAVSAM